MHPGLRPPARLRPRGFTLIELVMVILIIAALAAVALPRMMDSNAWRLRAFSDDLLSLTQSARLQALSQRRPIKASFSATGMRLAFVSGGTIATLDCPSAVPQCMAETAERSITFNSGHSGTSSSSTGAAFSLTITDGLNFRRVLTVETETGLIRPLT